LLTLQRTFAFNIGEIMKITLNNKHLLERLKTRVQTHKKFSVFEDQLVDIGRIVIEESQKWLDMKPWSQPDAIVEYYDTQRECRIELKRFVMKSITFADKQTSYYTPDHLFTWSAHQIINYVVKLVIEDNWDSILG
jgi:hypothetical protein